jgi:hypothetical protein
MLGVPADRIKDFVRRAGEQDQAVWIIGGARAGAGIRVE